MTIRREQPGDFENIYRLVKEAFREAEVSDGDEQDYVVGLRESDAYIPELALVAETEAGVVGHIMLTKTVLTRARGGQDDVLLLSPLSVKPAFRSRGIGGELIGEACRRAAGKGYKAVFLAGDPDYYSRFGFVPAADFGIGNRNGIPDRNALVKELVPGALKGMEGVADII